MTMTKEELNEIIEKHRKWLISDRTGERANLSGVDLRTADLSNADLSGADLRGADLRSADLSNADLSGADLRGADLRSADLWHADLRNADLSNADLSGANLRRADLSGANLRRADLRGADLWHADLSGANLGDADLSSAIIRDANLTGVKKIYVPMTCPDTGAFIGWKKAGELIVKLQIPEEARRSSATGRKCRCDKALVLAIENIDGTPAGVNSVCSDYSSGFEYKVGETVTEPAFCVDRFVECAPGIHFFINRQEAVEYNY